MKLRHTAALALVGWYLMVPSPSCAAGSSAGSVDVRRPPIYAASGKSEAPGRQGSDDPQLRDEIENEWYLMCPPFTSETPGVDLSAPFTQWRMGTHWPNRVVCEHQRTGLAQNADRWICSHKETFRSAATAAQHCRCFSSSDPRLDKEWVRKVKQGYLEQLYQHGLLKTPPE